MGMPIDLTGQRFGRLVADVRSDNDKRGECRWECVCDCGKRTVVLSSHLRKGRIKSCGCLAKELSRERLMSIPNRGHFTHNGSNTRLYETWVNMKTRCLNPNNRAYKWYGAVGVTICQEWMQFENFQQWALSSGYTDDLTIDRIDPSGNYCPNNCRWITISEQQNNRKSNHYLTYNGETHTVKDWAKITGLRYATLLTRINREKWDVERALTTPVKKVVGSCQD